MLPADGTRRKLIGSRRTAEPDNAYLTISETPATMSMPTTP